MLDLYDGIMLLWRTLTLAVLLCLVFGLIVLGWYAYYRIRGWR